MWLPQCIVRDDPPETNGNMIITFFCQQGFLRLSGHQTIAPWHETLAKGKRLEVNVLY